MQEDLKVSKDLRVEQSFEDLEKLFEPDEKFSFDAVIKLQETDWRICSLRRFIQILVLLFSTKESFIYILCKLRHAANSYSAR